MTKKKENERINLMGNIIIMSPTLKKRFDKIKEFCMNEPDIKKPDNVTWDEIAFTYMLVITENFQNGEVLYRYSDKMFDSEKDKEEFEKAMEEIARLDKEMMLDNQRVLEIVKKMVSQEFFENIEYELKVSEHTHSYRITDSSEGDLDRDDPIKVWVDQSSWGDSGDSYTGTISVELPNGKYLAWDYWM